METIEFVETISLNYMNYHFLHNDCGNRWIYFDFFDYIANQSVFLKIKDILSVVLLRKILGIQIFAAEGFKFSAFL